MTPAKGRTLVVDVDCRVSRVGGPKVGEVFVDLDVPSSDDRDPRTTCESFADWSTQWSDG